MDGSVTESQPTLEPFPELIGNLATDKAIAAFPLMAHRGRSL
jgi:hypothetical protein